MQFLKEGKKLCYKPILSESCYIVTIEGAFYSKRDSIIN